MTFYYPSAVDGRTRTRQFDFALTRVDNETVYLNRTGDGASEDKLRESETALWSIVYDLRNETMTGYCSVVSTLDISANGTTVPCMRGSYQDSYLSFELQDLRTRITTGLRAVDREWSYGNDAPSFVLQYVEPGRRVAMKSTVTKPNDCEDLKICLASRTLGFDMLAPLGRILLDQGAFASWCTKPKLYSL